MISNYEQRKQVETSSYSRKNISSSSNKNNTDNVNTGRISEESDEDLFTVPDAEAGKPMDSTINSNSNTPQNNNSQIQNQKRRRGRNPVDKEYRRLKRLLRNRVSAQQARERKKVYVNDLEQRAKELQDTNSKLEENISTLINENNMLRKVLMNTRPKVDESIEKKQGSIGKELGS